MINGVAAVVTTKKSAQGHADKAKGHADRAKKYADKGNGLAKRAKKFMSRAQKAAKQAKKAAKQAEKALNKAQALGAPSSTPVTFFCGQHTRSSICVVSIKHLTQYQVLPVSTSMFQSHARTQMHRNSTSISVLDLILSTYIVILLR